MKTLLIASVVAVSATASAQPSLTAVAPAPEPAPASYVAGGVTAGAFVGLYAAWTVEGGRQLGDGPLWVHGMLIDGATAGIDEGGTAGRQMQARIGLEARGCVAMQLCAIAGVDAAVAHGDYMGYEDNGNRTDALAIGRLGLDLGGKHLRLRPGIEMGVGAWRAGLEQFALTTAVAYRF